ncbi:MAG: major capsid protein [Microvirus sp.]|nr:MAG: major capsid protein [Microvirus sp.]
MKSVMNHNFANIPAPQIQRSVFDRSHGYKTTFDAGYLIPFFIDEILPGDTLGLNATIFARIATLLQPIMDNVFLETFFFFVPNRILWNNWEKFQGAQTDPGDSTDYLIPIIDMEDDGQFASGDIYDYFGLPTNIAVSGTEPFNALPCRAYNLIWNEWFRSQDLQDSLNVPKDDGPDSIGLYALKKRGKRHDYFTSCLPWPQKGDAIELPLGISAPVVGNGTTLGLYNLNNVPANVYAGLVQGPLTAGVYPLGVAQDLYGDPVGTTMGAGTPITSLKGIGVTQSASNSGLIADLSTATAATINQLREAFAFQKILERDARGGTRYVEILKSHFGVSVPDYRLQRPEYLGGGSQRVDVKAVAQTTGNPTTPGVKPNTPQGTLAAFSQVGQQSGFNKSFVEHGYVIGLVNVRSDISYQGGINKLWSRRERFDFYMPSLAHLGEQPVYNKEIYYPANGTGADTVFGYQERWAEYRYKPSMVTGKFRSDLSDTLDSWHLALDFDASPSLNDSFMQDDPPLDRVIAVPSQPHVIMDSYISMRHARPMPVYSVPGQLDRF